MQQQHNLLALLLLAQRLEPETRLPHKPRHLQPPCRQQQRYLQQQLFHRTKIKHLLVKQVKKQPFTVTKLFFSNIATHNILYISRQEGVSAWMTNNSPQDKSPHIKLTPRQLTHTYKTTSPIFIRQLVPQVSCPTHSSSRSSTHKPV